MVLQLVCNNDVLSIAEARMLYSNGVVTSRQVVLDNDAVTSDDVFLCNLLRDDLLTRHVRYLENDVLTAQVQLTVKLYAESAFEYWVREDVPLSCVVNVRQTVRRTIVFAEARTVVVRSISVEVCSVCIRATKHLSVS